MKHRRFFILAAVSLLVFGVSLYLRENTAPKNPPAESLVPQNSHSPSLPLEELTSVRKEHFASRVEFPAASPLERESAKPQVLTAVQEWRKLTDRIRAIEPGPEKGALIEQYMDMGISGIPSTSIAILDALSEETDPILLDHHILLLQRTIDADGIQHLVELIDEARENPARQELFLKVMENLLSPGAMSALQEIVWSKKFTFKEPLLFYALRALARSGGEEDVRAIFNRINTEVPGNRQNFSFMVTAAVETSNPDALPFLLGVASGMNGKQSEDARLIAIYTLRNYRDNPTVNRLLHDLANSPKQAVASAASEALVAVK